MGTNNRVALAGLGMLLGACVYSEGMHGRYLQVDVPLHTVHTVQHTVRIHAPPGSTVVYGQMPLTAPAHVPGNMGSALRHADGGCLVWHGKAGTGVLAWAPCGRSAAWPVQWQQGRLRTGGWCVAVEDQGRLAARPCSGDVAQQWRYRGGQIHHLASGGCLDGGTVPVSVQACHGGPSQWFGY